ncbi:MAG: hypothetical protein ACM31C_21275 [Acidobacteriota bacterium]
MPKRASRLLLIAACAGCTPRYAYTFDRMPVPDPDVGADLVVDPATATLGLALTNRTDQVVQVGWTDIAIAGDSGPPLPLHPNADLGWIAPGATVHAQLFPLALPREGAAAVAYEGRHLDVTVPVIVRREPRQIHYTLVAHVREL